MVVKQHRSTPMATEKRGRVREVLPNLHLGYWKPGPKNSITDVEGVLAHTESIRIPASGDKGAVNTGVTTILPREDFLQQGSYAGIFRLNGAGEMTGSHWIEETGLLYSPIIITNTFAIGAAHQGVCEYCVKTSGDARGRVDWFTLPVIAETFDGYLNDLSQFAVKPEHIVRGIESATSDPVPEGNTGGGTGMVCHRFKGGSGSSSRLVPGLQGKEYTVGAFVQANYGRPRDLRIGGVPIGRLLAEEQEAVLETYEQKRNRVALEQHKDKHDGSIIIVIATDAPLNPVQLQRLAKRASVGLARVGGYGANQSGDIFIAFSTANKIPGLEGLSDSNGTDYYKPTPFNMAVVNDMSINGLMEATADAAEESIYNALCCAETMVGLDDHVVEALPLERVKKIMAKYLPSKLS